MDYQTKINATKEAAVKELKDEFSQYSGYIFADYRGLTVSELTNMRKQLRSKEAVCRVIKNRYAKIAMRELGHDQLDDKMVGPTLIVMGNGDEQNGIAKIVCETAKATNDKLQIKGGLIEGELYDAQQLEAYGKLPGRLELISVLMATMKAPVQKLAATLLAYKEKLESGAPVEAPKAEPAAEPAPVAEAAPAEEAAPAPEAAPAEPAPEAAPAEEAKSEN